MRSRAREGPRVRVGGEVEARARMKVLRATLCHVMSPNLPLLSLADSALVLIVTARSRPLVPSGTLITTSTSDG